MGKPYPSLYIGISRTEWSKIQNPNLKSLTCQWRERRWSSATPSVPLVSVAEKLAGQTTHAPGRVATAAAAVTVTVVVVVVIVNKPVGDRVVVRTPIHISRLGVGACAANDAQG